MKTEKEKTLSEKIKDIEEIIKLVRKNKLSLKKELKLVECLETLIKKQKQFIKETLDEIEIIRNEECWCRKFNRLTKKYIKDKEIDWDCPNCEIIKAIKQIIKQKAGGKLIE